MFLVPSHYFNETPEGEFKPKQIRVSLAGRELIVTTAGSVFSPDHLDQGTAVLLDQLSELPSTGTFIDVGCGWGPIAIALALSAPEAKIFAVDVNERSLELTRLNLEGLGISNVTVCRPEEVPEEILFDQVWSNPPIRVGKAVLHDILTKWLNRLSSPGWAYLVVQKNLGADSLHTWLSEEFKGSFETKRIEKSKGFRILRVNRP